MKIVKCLVDFVITLRYSLLQKDMQYFVFPVFSPDMYKKVQGDKWEGDIKLGIWNILF
jgi:hypothetical protein